MATTPHNPELNPAIAALIVEHKLLPVSEAENLLRGTTEYIVDTISKQIKKTDLLRIIAKEMNLDFYDSYASQQDYKIDLGLFDQVNIAFCKQYSALPLRTKTGKIVVAVALPTPDLNEYLISRLNDKFTYSLAEGSQIQDALAKIDSELSAKSFAANSNSAPLAPRPSSVLQPLVPVTQGDAPEFVTAMLTRAVADGASDIHLEYDNAKNLHILFRIDGIRRRIPGFDIINDRRKDEIINHILSRCEETINSIDKKIPQDGTFQFTAAGRSIDARVAALPQLNGLRVTIRLLDSRMLFTRLDDMGFSDRSLKIIRNQSNQPAGTILVTGPTGSGKSTTVYGLLRELDAETKAILTVEDPVEYRLPGIGQTPIKNEAGDRAIDFERAFRSILRSDPDVILIGEIRDAETARTAMQASITGHLVFSTIHATTSVGVFTRLIEMDIEPYLPANSITLTISQRLSRKLHECSIVEAPSAAEVSWFNDRGFDAPPTIARATGCPGCGGSGYRGRQALIELLEPDEEFKAGVIARKSDAALTAIALRNGFKPMIHDAVDKINRHLTTIQEIARVIDT
jgi:type IV pilus assembly protein PilB